MMNLQNQTYQQHYATPFNKRHSLIKELRDFHKLPNSYEEFAHSHFDEVFLDDKKHYALTLTLKQTYVVETNNGNYLKRLSFDDCENIGRRFLAYLGRSVWRHNYKRYGKRLTAVWAIENGSYKRNYHLHFAIGNLPKYVNQQWLNTKIEKIKKQITEIHRLKDIQQIYSRRFNGYLTKELRRHNYDNFHITH